MGFDRRSSYVLGWITDDILIPAVESGNVAGSSLAAAAAAILGVAAFRGAGITFLRLGAYEAQYRLQYSDRIEVTDRYLRLPLEWHRKRRPASCLGRRTKTSRRLRSSPHPFPWPSVPQAGPAAASSTVALRSTAVTLEPEQNVAIVGETGSGKTTFAKLLTRLMDPTEGRITMSGLDLRDVRFESLRDRVVMVPQDGVLFRGTIADNVRMGNPSATSDELEATFARLGLTDWLDELAHGIHTQVGERGSALSVGERQLVTLVRAAVADPDLLVLDEATSAADPATEVRTGRTLRELTRGRTVVTIAHRISTAETADRVLVFDDGAIVQDGSHRRLVEEGGAYGRLHASWRRGTA